MRIMLPKRTASTRIGLLAIRQVNKVCVGTAGNLCSMWLFQLYFTIKQSILTVLDAV